MPVLDQTTSNSYTGNGVTTVFAYTFKLLDSADVLVTVDGVVKTLTTHYTVSGVGASGGGNITFLAAPANAAEVVIQRDMDYLRETDYQDNGDLLAATLDEDIDRVVMQVQQVRDVGVRSIKIPAGETTDQLITAAAADRANKAVIFDASGNVTVSTDDFNDQLANVTAQAVAAAASASSASGSASTATTQAGIATAQAVIATTQAGIATTQAGAAAISASAAQTAQAAAELAETNAETAETNAEAALADALVIYGSIAAVEAAAAAAQLAETNAETAEVNAELAETNAETAAAAALVSENAAEAAYNASIAIYGSLGAVQAAQSSASASATAASDSATTAIAQAAAAAASALSAASVVSQDLSAIDRIVFAATIFDAFLYDTEKDSDGGAWRKRCAHTSWENETLSGNWLGSAANEAAARAISGATTGSYYYDTTAAGFYTLNAGSGKTATYRGNVRQFPAKVLITGEYPSPRIVLWDLTQAGCPMWMVFYRNDTSEFLRFSFEPSLGMLNGMLAVGGGIIGGVSYYGCLRTADFISDRMRQWGGGSGYDYNYTSPVGIASRNTAAVNFQPVVNQANRVSPGLVDARISDFAMTVLPTAPVDVATGLPVPTIAVGTEGNATYSTSVIKDDGTVVNVASDSTGTAVGVEFDGLVLKVIRSDGNVYYWNDVRALTTGASPSATVSASTTPAALGTASKQAKRALSSSTGVTLMIRNQLTLASSMVAYMTKDYNSGWMVGDIRGAWLADITAETKVGGTDTDRSVKANDFTVNGTLTKAAVASGAALVGYSGWSAANYMERAYDADFDFGTSGFCLMGWLKEAANSAIETLFERDSSSTAQRFTLSVTAAGYLEFTCDDNTTTRAATGTVAVDDGVWRFVCCTFDGSTLTIYVNGVSYATATGSALLTLNNASAVIRNGCDVAGSYPATNATMALRRIGATIPSAEQIKHIYETEKALFKANAQCCLAGTSNAVTALAYDDETDLLHVGTSYGRSAFKGLVRVASEATPVGAITALAASAGVVVQGGASGADVYVPAYTLREELLRDAEQMAKFGQNLIAHDFTATASQTTFTLPVGWEIVAVYQQGSIKRETTSWTRSFDGFKWSAVLGTGATVSDWISILAKRVPQ